MKNFLIFSIAAVLVASGVFLWVQQSEKGTIVVKIEKGVAAGNMGSHTFYYVYLENGSEITYDYYRSNHPLCPEMPEKCGEDSKDPGWNVVNQTVNSQVFRRKETDTGTEFIPERSICMQSRTSYTSC